jgi:hypothetical protein
MGELDYFENNISLLGATIEFEELVDIFLSENYPESDIEGIDKLGFRRDKLFQLQYRFSNFYDLDIFVPENGYSLINIIKDDIINPKKYLHRFLSYKTLTGGDNANNDGSAKLFEDISANAVKNFLGEGAKSIMVGEGRENLTFGKLDQISVDLKENKGVYNNLPPMAKDDGVDFIVYKPLDDRNVGNLLILGQACIGKNFNQKKPIKSRWRCEYINYAVKPPLTLLSIVSFVESIELRKIHSEFDDAIIFDRGRILKYFDSSDVELNERIINFVENNIH